MHLSFRTFFVVFFISAIGLWGEAIEVSRYNSCIDLTEVCETTEEESKEDIKSTLEIFEKPFYSGQGDDTNEDVVVINSSLSESIEQSFGQILVTYQNYCADEEGILPLYDAHSFKSFSLHKLYILYHCSKAFLC
jgi:hypothetical protein